MGERDLREGSSDEALSQPGTSVAPVELIMRRIMKNWAIRAGVIAAVVVCVTPDMALAYSNTRGMRTGPVQSRQSHADNQPGRRSAGNQGNQLGRPNGRGVLRSFGR